eukprot:c19828_g1_i1 orf=127-2145(+)
MGESSERHSSRSRVAARAPALVRESRERCSLCAPASDAFNSCSANGIDSHMRRGEPLPHLISCSQNIDMCHEAENSRALYLACGEGHEFDLNDAEGEDACGGSGFHPPSSTSDTAPSSSPYVCFTNSLCLEKQKAGESSQKSDFLFQSEMLCVDDLADSTLHKAPDSVICHQRTSLLYKARKGKKLNKKAKPLQLANRELVSKSDVTRVQRTWRDIDVGSDTPFNLPKSDVSAVFDVVGDNQEQHVRGTSDARRRGFGTDCDGIKAEEMDEEKGGLNRERMPFLAWFAGVSIHALQFQFKFMFGLLFSLVYAWYHSFRFALNPINYMLQAKVKATEAHGKDYVTLGPKIKKRVFSSVQPTFATGARRLAFGCLTALYTTIMLTFLFVASLALSFCVVKGFVHEPVQLYEYLYLDYTKPLPVASVDFASSKMYLDTGSMIKRIVCRTIKFQATVFLTVPESEFNKELGIFQVTAELLSATGQVLLSRTQPCMLRFKSTALQHAKSFLMAIPLLTGFYSETQTLAVSSLEWQEQRSFSFAAVRVMLAPRAGRPLHMGLPELYEAGLSVKSELPWWVSFIGHWRWTLSVWLGLALFVGIVVLVMCLCNQFLLPDLGRVFPVVADGLVQRNFNKVKAACLKHEKVITERALEAMPPGGEQTEFVFSENSCTSSMSK